MRTAEQAKTAVAGVVGRWQVDDLHEGHRTLIDEVMKQHRKVIIFVGTSPILGSRHNPLDYPSRQKMIQEHYPAAIVLPIADQADDKVWSANLDALVRQVAPLGEVTLYGGRDSFIQHYTGRFRTIELDALCRPDGTEVRLEAGRTVRSSADFRAGVIYSTQNQYPRTHLTVDIGVLRQTEEGVPCILLGKKPNRAGWRFPGGFFDPLKDTSLEAAVRRELYEEADVNIEQVEYAGSFLIPDWRLDEPEVILTAFFIGYYTYGNIVGTARDDLESVEWFPVADLPNMKDKWAEEHRELFEYVIAQRFSGITHKHH